MTGLTRKDIEDVLRLIDNSAFDELKLEMGDLKLELRRRGAASAPQPNASAPSAKPEAGPAPAAPTPPVTRTPADATRSGGGGTAVASPLLGTFYHVPKPGAEAFVKPGDTVSADTVIGIIEVMKLMNSVTAGVSGTVTEIVAPNGVLVEHGQTLIRVQEG